MRFDCRMSKGLKDQHLLMESTIRMTKVVTLALVVVATFSSTAAGKQTHEMY